MEKNTKKTKYKNEKTFTRLQDQIQVHRIKKNKIITISLSKKQANFLRTKLPKEEGKKIKRRSGNVSPKYCLQYLIEDSNKFGNLINGVVMNKTDPHDTS